MLVIPCLPVHQMTVYLDIRGASEVEKTSRAAVMGSVVRWPKEHNNMKWGRR